ncbi:hypothetical protein ACFVS7_07860 [Streptomyces rubiginosohelvolus]|uniref:hypothetical protein n=1 Tax=Streptomyces rubiginosohelvolus TaxID=67362 RepID=UPI0036DCC545
MNRLAQAARRLNLGRGFDSRPRADLLLAGLREAAELFAGQPYRVPPRIAGAVWTGAYAMQVTLLRQVVALMACQYVSLVAALGAIDPVLASLVSGNWARFGSDVQDFLWEDDGYAVRRFTLFGILLVVGVLTARVMKFRGWVSFRSHRPTRRQELRFRSRSIRSRRNRVPVLCALLIVQCARVKAAIPHQSALSLQDIDTAVELLGREVMRLSGDKPQFRRRSPRSKAVRHHTCLVAAALRKATLRVDSDPAAGTAALADMALRICDAYVRSEWGRLLEEQELAGLEPVRSRELLRITAAGAATVGAAVAGALIGIPDAVLPLVFGFVGVLAFTRLLGVTPSSLSLLDSMRGVQRP